MRTRIPGQQRMGQQRIEKGTDKRFRPEVEAGDLT